MGKKGQKTIEKIKNEAMTLFLEKGYKDVSMQDICYATGLSKGGLYRHFGSKSEILLSLLGDERSIDVIGMIEDNRPAIEILTLYLNEFFQNMLMSEKSLAYALFEYASSEQECKLTANNKHDALVWESLIAYGIKTGEFNDIDYRIVMNTLLFAYRGVRIWCRAIDIDAEIPKSIIDAVKQLVIKNSLFGTVCLNEKRV